MISTENVPKMTSALATALEMDCLASGPDSGTMKARPMGRCSGEAAVMSARCEATTNSFLTLSHSSPAGMYVRGGASGSAVVAREGWRGVKPAAAQRNGDKGTRK